MIRIPMVTQEIRIVSLMSIDVISWPKKGMEKPLGRGIEKISLNSSRGPLISTVFINS
jgi:hypothetical protein